VLMEVAGLIGLHIPADTLSALPSWGLPAPSRNALRWRVFPVSASSVIR